jgi:adenosylcobinamide-GDP ribazoletransferase
VMVKAKAWAVTFLARGFDPRRLAFPPPGHGRVELLCPSPATPSFPPPWLQDLAGAWIFYSVLPPWPGIRPRFERIARFAPWMGLLIGALQALIWWLLQGHVPLLAQVCAVLAAGLWLTGGLHMDGAMDTADGLAAGDRLLEAMQDSRVGASGAQALAVLLLLKAAALATLQGAAPLALVWAALWGRMAPLLAVAWFPYLHAEGSAGFHRKHWTGLLREARPGLMAVGALLWLSLFLGWGGAGLAGAVPALLVPRWLGRRLGGHSGDSYGACVEWTEGMALVLMVLARIAPSGPAG